MPAAQEPGHINLYPELDDELDAAYEQARQGQSPEPVGIAAVVSELSKTPFPEISKAFHNQLSAVHAEASKLYSVMGLTVPSLEELHEGGIDFAKLETGRDDLLDLGGADYEPEVVIAPVVPIRYWMELFNKSEFAHGGGSSGTFGGLYFDIERLVPEHWNEMMNMHDGAEIGKNQWECNVLPAQDRPPIQNITLEQADQHYDTLAAKAASRPSISTYLAMQALKLGRGAPLVDNETKTWLDHGPLKYSESRIGADQLVGYVFRNPTSKREYLALDFVGRGAECGARPCVIGLEEYPDVD